MAVACILKLVNVILGFCVISIGVASATAPKSVNLAVETSFLFEPQDIQQNATMLKSVRRFLDQLENLLSPDNTKPTLRAQNDTTGNVKNGNNNGSGKRLTNFLTELGGIVINYDEDDIKRLAAALDNEVAENYITNPRFHEMFKNDLIKMFIANTVKEWTTTDHLKLKVEIAKYITGDEESAFVNFFRSLNQFFDFDKSKFNKLVKKFVKAKNTKMFAKPVQKTFELIFNRYEMLDDDSKNRLHEELDKLTKNIVINYKHRLDHVNLFRRSLKSDSTTARDLSESVKEEFNSDNSIENVKVDGNEIRIDKDVQVNVGTYRKDIDA